MDKRLEDPLQTGERLLQRAWNRDGLPELAVGATFLLCAALIWLEALLPKGTPLHTAAVLAFAAGLPLLIWMLGPVVRKIRTTWLLDRTGYMEPLPKRRRIEVRTLLPLAFLAGVLPLVVLTRSPGESLLPAATGAAGAVLFTAIGVRSRVVRFVLAGLAMAAAGAVLAAMRLPIPSAMALLFGSQALLLLAMGGIVFLRFLRSTGTGDER